MRFLLFLLFQLCLCAADFDCIIIGTSPFSLFEALYHSHSGRKVLILEEAFDCGGAWRSIDICGVSHVDMGCHSIGKNGEVKRFLEEYAGCKPIYLDDQQGWYFSQGCFELIDHLMQLIANTDITLCTNCKAESATINAQQKIATVLTKNGAFTTHKLIVTPMSCISFNIEAPQEFKKKGYYHLYLLIQDPTNPKFSYLNGISKGVSRLMNLTSFVGLAGTGRQLIVVQTHEEKGLSRGQTYLDDLKSKKLIDPSAYLIKAETYIYETGAFHQGLIAKMGAQEIVEILQTGHIEGLAKFIPKWKQALKPFKDNL